MSHPLPSEVVELLEKALDERRRLACPVAWKIAGDHDVSVRAIGDWANDNGVKVHACALGCFP